MAKYQYDGGAARDAMPAKPKATPAKKAPAERRNAPLIKKSDEAHRQWQSSKPSKPKGTASHPVPAKGRKYKSAAKVTKAAAKYDAKYNRGADRGGP